MVGETRKIACTIMYQSEGDTQDRMHDNVSKRVSELLAPVLHGWSSSS